MTIPRTMLLLAASGMTAACTYAVQPEARPQIDTVLALSAQVIRDESFAAALSKMPADDFDHSADNRPHENDSGSMVVARLVETPINDVVCRRAKNPFNRKTNAWEGGGTPQLRCAFLKRRSNELWAGTIVHEQAHAAGYFHNGEKRSGNQCTVPHVVGDLATHILEVRRGGSSLPKDVCPALRNAVCRSGSNGEQCAEQLQPRGAL